MKIAMAADQGGFAGKEALKKKLIEEGHEVHDFGCFSEDSVDYPDFAAPCAKAVASGEYEKGILLCGTGIGVSITANKVPGIRCALVSDAYTAKMTREHNDSNILAMGGRVLSINQIMEIAEIWLSTPFSNEERHLRRIHKIAELEKEHKS